MLLLGDKDAIYSRLQAKLLLIDLEEVSTYLADNKQEK
jgi:hypothetical protein